MSCIYCGGSDPYSDEHVLTRALAGPGEDWVLKDLVCKRCNALFSRYERAWTSEPGVAMARIGHGPLGRTRKGQVFQFHPSEQMFLEVKGDPVSYEADILPNVTPRLRYQVIDTGVSVFPAASSQADVNRFAPTWNEFVATPEVTIQKNVTANGTFYRVAKLQLAGTPKIVKVDLRQKPAEAWWDTFDPGFAQFAHPRMSLDPFSRIRFRTARFRQIPQLLDRIFSAGQITAQAAVHEAGSYHIKCRSTFDLEKVPRAVAKTLVNYMADKMGAAYVANPAFRPLLDYCLGGPDRPATGPFVSFLPHGTGAPDIDQLPPDRHLLHLVSNGRRVVGILKLYGAVAYRVHLGPAPSPVPYEHTTRIDYNGPGRVVN